MPTGCNRELPDLVDSGGDARQNSGHEVSPPYSRLRMVPTRWWHAPTSKPLHRCLASPRSGIIREESDTAAPTRVQNL